MDSLNRRYLPVYGNRWVKTPNIDRLAAESVVFQNNYCGSMPCIPARRDLFTGRYSFLEAPWGPLEPWDELLPVLLRERCGVYSHMITDHPHYFNGGAGDLYHNSYDSWEYMRGQPYDPWHGIVDPPDVPEDARIYCYPKYRHQYMANLQYRDLENEDDYSSVRCIKAACEFIEKNHAADNWFLHLELFDPHEPFEAPERFRKLYGDDWDRQPFTCPEYEPLLEGRDDEPAIEHIRKSYAATLTMIDEYLGILFDAFDRYTMWEDTAVIVTTDHGYMLGEHDYWAKNYMLPYQELVNTPLIVHYPDGIGRVRTPQREASETTTAKRKSPQPQLCEALAGMCDLMPTILELFGADRPVGPIHGKSLLPLLRGETDRLHETLLYGTFGKEVGLTDGRFSYHRVPEEGSVVHHHACHPCRIDPELLGNAEFGTFLSNCKGIPHFRIAKESKRSIDIDVRHLLFDLKTDPGQTDNLLSEDTLNQKSDLEVEYAGKLQKMLQKMEAPECQLTRLGLV